MKINEMRLFTSIGALLVACPFLVHSQEFKEKEKEKERFYHHQVEIGLGHLHVPTATESGDKKWLVVPNWAINYSYWFTRQWAVGLHNDIVSEEFKVEHNKIEIERKHPITSCLIGIFRPGKHFGYIVGLGGEFTTEETFFVSRLGAEYGYEIPGGWEFNGAFLFDMKWNAYPCWSIGLGVSKLF